MTIIETNRLLLRHFRDTDIDDFASMQADPEVMRFFPSGTRTRKNVQDTIALFHALQAKHGYSLWAIESKIEGTFLGYCGLMNQQINEQDEVEVGYMVARSYWGQNFATEAARGVCDWGFAHLDVKRLVSITDPDNIASVRVAEKNGMRYWQDVIYKGKTCHVYMVEAP